MQTHARVVIIGAGIVGCSTAYELTRLGWRDIVVLEQGPLGQNWGSTSHAPGMMFQHNVSRSVTQLAMGSAQLIQRGRDARTRLLAHRQHGDRLHAGAVGGVEAARRAGDGRGGWTPTLIGADEAGRMLPILRTDDLYGAFFVPGDCVVNAAAIAQRFGGGRIGAGRDLPRRIRPSPASRSRTGACGRSSRRRGGSRRRSSSRRRASGGR